MNTRTSLIRVSTFVALIGCAAVSAQVFAREEAVMTIDDRAPLRATLMPTVSVLADAAHPDAATTWSVAATRPQRVTLMPTMRVTAQAESLAVTLMPTITVTAQVDAIAATALPDVRVNPIRASFPAVASTLQSTRSNVDNTNASAASGRNLQVVPR